MSKLNPNQAFNGTTVVLCDCCGRPISSPSKFDREDEHYDYEQQANFPHENGKTRGRHFNCNVNKVMYAQKQAEDAFAALSPEERAVLDDQAADAFNRNGGVDKREHSLTSIERPVFVPEPGQVSLDRIQAAGGLSKLPDVPDPKAAAIAAADEALHDAQTAEREQQLRADFEREQAELLAQNG